jgi:hypothetical protein
MKKKILALLLLSVVVFSAPVMAEKLIFTEYGVSYASILTPKLMENNSTGTFDTAAFDIKVGVSACKWAEAYVGAGFQAYIFTANAQENYSYFPIYGGVRANIFPDWTVYPDLMFEYGRAISNLRYQYMTTLGPMSADSPWIADYYSFGLGINWRIEDIAILALKIERPSYSNLNKSDGEIHIIKVGVSWQIYY